MIDGGTRDAPAMDGCVEGAEEDAELMDREREVVRAREVEARRVEGVDDRQLEGIWKERWYVIQQRTHAMF